MIRPAKPEDLDKILEIYQSARDFMKQNGNENQWGDTHPPRPLLEEDIKTGQLYVYQINETVHGVFALIIGDDPTYAYIENGAWLNEEAYGTIHRIASAGKTKNVFGACLAYCQSRIANIRIDTHEENLIMQHVLKKHGFKKCGIIYLPDGDPRIAYQTWKTQ